MPESLQNSPLLIGIDGRELLPDTFTGFGRYIENFLNAKITRGSHHRFTIYGNQHTRFPNANANYTFKRLEEQNTLWWDQVTIVKAIRQDRIDLFFTPYDKMPVRSPCPVVMTVHDLLYQYVSDLSGLKKWTYNTLYRMQRGYMARHAARVLTVSEHSRDDISRYYNLPPNQIVITHNAVSDRFHAGLDKTTVEDVKKKYKIPAPYIFNLNNFKPHKNPGGLIEAYAQLPSDLQKQIHLVIGGKHNSFTQPLQQRVKALGLSDAVHFPGIIHDEDLPAIYAGADLFVITSFYEGFGIPPIEAMASGTPVVSSNATSLPEVIGDAGLLVSPDDVQSLTVAMKEILSDENLRTTLIQKGLQRIREFTQERVAGKILDALEETAHIALKNEPV
ncbi:MAG: glycosyltransferase family 4 protein [Candidatus Latescibacteria bacterium]|jgi:glycosyltransferase involved in cell wall biosynthesis|nr:glycosyltransferase family 4 protein [Candidatus Latescibacterota bacterium]MBT5833153.1 glycosyltransferase family 4 protein [Candidatus Latescibacterota bacterium]